MPFHIKSRRRRCGRRPATRWTTDLPSKVTLPQEIDCGALCGASLVTLHPEIQGERHPRSHDLRGRTTGFRVSSFRCRGTSHIRNGFPGGQDRVQGYLAHKKRVSRGLRPARENDRIWVSGFGYRSTSHIRNGVQGYLAHKKRGTGVLRT